MNKQTTEARKELFARNLRKAIDAKQVSIKHVAEVTGVSYERLRRWSTSGLSQPTRKTEEALHKLCRYFFEYAATPGIFWRTSEIKTITREKNMLHMLDMLQYKAASNVYLDGKLKNVQEEIHKLYNMWCGSGFLSIQYEQNTFADEERYRPKIKQAPPQQPPQYSSDLSGYISKRK